MANSIFLFPGNFTFSGSNVTFTGQALFADGTAAAPSIAFANEPATGFYRAGANNIAIAFAGANYYDFTTGGFNVVNGVSIGFGATALGVQDVTLQRDSADTLAQRRGTNPQAFRIYNTFTDASNYERMSIGWAANTFQIKEEIAGTGVPRAIAIDGSSDIYFNQGGVGRWFINSGHFKAQTDNTLDIGASGATRPRTGYFGTSLVSPFYNSNASSVLTISSNTIAPTGSVHHVGAGLIKTITVPAGITTTGSITIIPDVAYTYDATGNIVVPVGGGLAVINKAMTFTWDGTKWTPSY